MRFTDRGRASRRYSTKDACGNCQSYNHDRCRPKLDGTLCGCNCERAEIARTQFERKAAAAQSAGEPQPTVEKALEILHPRFRKLF